MRILTALTVAAAMLFGTAAAQAATGREAKGIINAALKRSNRVPDKAPFKTKLGGKAGDKLRPFTASNIRTRILPGGGPPGALGGVRIHVGSRVTGTLNMKSDRVTIKSVIMPKSMPGRHMPGRPSV